MNRNEQFEQLKMQVLRRFFARMNDRQQEAVFAVDGPVLVLAGAGSGKTTVLINRIANLIRFGQASEPGSDTRPVSEADIALLKEYLAGDTARAEDVIRRIAVRPVAPWRILAITFTNKAAGELKERLSKMLGEDGNDIWASTFHSACARMLRKDGDRLGYSSHFTVYDTDDAKRVIKECMKSLRIDEKEMNPRTVMSEISKAKDALLTPEDYLTEHSSDFRLRKVGDIYRMYQSRLKEADAMDFDDLLFNAVRLLQEQPEVRDYYRSKFEYIMVDEYQDTNHAQFELVRLLAEPRCNLCVVGDDDQSIYRFRGANIGNILGFETVFHGCKTIRLEQNYRSTQTILDAANAVIAHNKGRKGKTLWTQNGTGGKIDAHTALDEQDEAKYISEQVLDMVSKGRKFGDVAILYRMNAQSSTIERTFTRMGVLYRIIGGHRFYERKEIRDMIAYLSVLANPDDSVRLRRIINEPKRSIGEKTVENAMEIGHQVGMSLYEVIRHADEFEVLKRSASKLRAFADLMDGLIAEANDPGVQLQDLYQHLLSKIDYVGYLRAQNDETETRIENINELSTNLIHYQEENGDEATLSGFLEEVALLTDIDNYNESADAVTMMTLHSAKGLEFPVVFIPGMEEYMFPGYQATLDPEELEEERRLAYVGITRARELLTVTNANQRLIYGTTQRNKPSRFIDEMPAGVKNVSVARSWKVPEPGVKVPVSVQSTRETAIRSAHSIGTMGGMSTMGTRPTGTGTMGAGAVGSRGTAAAGRTTRPVKPQTVLYKVGDLVEHKTFGEGMVLSATKMGNDTLLEIAFEKVGTKKIFANFANLKRKLG
jgi:DNA helicase-2/ATP-dependent DNA helicase PcrA